MTYDHDPARWTSSPDEAPELLRGAFAAARNEGPSRSHLRALSVKLAAASAAGGAVAVGTVKAASAGNAIATAATWSAAKIAGVIAIAGSVVTGAVLWQQSSASTESVQRKTRGAQLSPPSAEPAPNAVAAEPSGPVSVELGTAPVIDQLPSTHEGAENPSARESASRSRIGQAQARPFPAAHAADAHGSAARAGKATKPASSSGAKTTSQAADEATSELSLLQSAQAALATRPRQAFQLTQQHRKLYPQGEFAQERDALAIQALMRAGETESARNLAQAFIRSYPGSPNAHRFREAMDIR